MPTRHFPPLPQIGLPESYYAQMAKKADQEGNLFAREAAKVAQYITLGLDPNLDWLSKRRYFEHALRRHCVPQLLLPSHEVQQFFKNLSETVRRYSGQEALRLASREDDQYAIMSRTGVPKHVIQGKGQVFFSLLMGLESRKPDWFNEEDWSQLKIIRAQWI
jgi:hypothetical protein